MKLTRIELTNFWGFATWSCDLDPAFNVLIGANGSGKSSAVEALRIALEAIPRGLGYAVVGLDHHDVRRSVSEHQGLHEIQRHYPCKVAVEAIVDGQTLRWERELRGKGGRTTWAGLGALRPVLTKWQQEGASLSTLPVVAVYSCDRLERTYLEPESRGEDDGGDGSPDSGSGRGFGDGSGNAAGSDGGAGFGDGTGSGAGRALAEPAPHWQRGLDAVRAVQERFDAYQGAFWSNDRLTALVGWIRIQTLADYRREEPLPHLRAVLGAIAGCLPDVQAAWYDLPQEMLLVRFHDGEVKPFDVLSDGYIAMLGIFADVALRCVLLNRHLGDAALQQTPGVVVIDEIDLHLHPRWQRRVVADLRRTFPSMQFIVATHSPQVIASAQAAWVRVLGRDEPPRRVAHVHGRDSNALLEDVMEVPARPHETQVLIDAMFAHIDEGEYPEAERRLGDLLLELGPDDADVIRARWMLDMEVAHAAVPEGE